MINAANAPLDPVSEATLASRGLRLGLVDTADRAAFTTWLRADHRGFHMAEQSDEVIEANLAGLAYRRTTGVWDGGASDAASPVATVNSWVADLTVPGGRHVDAWAISSVTVAPTHRRRGIARALLEGELRTAAGLGVPLATLTVSESTIYGRFGFAAATFSADVTIDTRRATWTGPTPDGRLHFITLAEFRTLVERLHDQQRATAAGQLDGWAARWDALSGAVNDDKDRTKNLRAIRYDDAAGAAQGVALYRVANGEVDYAAHTLTLEHLVSVTDDAYAALWRFVLEVDLVSTVKTWDRPVDEPVIWQVADLRAVKLQPYDHVWTRILDIPAALTARGYAAPLSTVLEVSDELGFAFGTYAVTVVDGSATVEATDAPASLSLRINDLSALYLGGVSAAALVAAGRIHEREPGAAAAVDTAFRSARAPWSSIWF